MATLGPQTTGSEIVEYFVDQVRGRTFLITGTSIDSLGAETATSLAYGSPARLLLLGRDIEKVQPVIDHIRIISPSTEATFIRVSLDSLTSVRKAAAEILNDSMIDKIDVIVNNAGIMAAPFSLTEDGIECQFQINHISHFLLTALLLPKLTRKGSLTRVVNVSSYGNIFCNVKADPNFDGGKSYDPWLAYGQSKTANVLHVVGLNQRSDEKGVKAFAVNPGSVQTNLRRYMTSPETLKAGLELHKRHVITPPGRKTLQQGCATILVAALDPDLRTDGSVFLSDCSLTADPKIVAEYALNKENAEKCWALSESLLAKDSTV